MAKTAKQPTLMILAACACMAAARAERYEVYETYPGSSARDWSRPKTVIRERR